MVITMKENVNSCCVSIKPNGAAGPRAEETPDDSYFSIRRQQGFKHDHWRDELSLEVRKVTVLTENSAN